MRLFCPKPRKTYPRLMPRNARIILLCFKEKKVSNFVAKEMLWSERLIFSCKSCSLPQGGGLLKRIPAEAQISGCTFIKPPGTDGTVWN